MRGTRVPCMIPVRYSRYNTGHSDVLPRRQASHTPSVRSKYGPFSRKLSVDNQRRWPGEVGRHHCTHERSGRTQFHALMPIGLHSRNTTAYTRRRAWIRDGRALRTGRINRQTRHRVRHSFKQFPLNRGHTYNYRHSGQRMPVNDASTTRTTKTKSKL